MKPLQNIRHVPLVHPSAIVDNASFTSQVIDTVNNGTKYESATVVFQFGAMDIAMAALKVQHSEDGSTNWADISGADFAAALPSATADNTFFAVDINLHGKRRYLRAVATGGDGTAGTFMSGYVLLAEAGQSPNSASERGFNGLLQVA